MMPPPSAGPDTSWPMSSPHEPAADTDRPSCRGGAGAVRCGTAPGASRHRSRLLHARWRRAPRPRPHRRGTPPSVAEPGRTRACPAYIGLRYLINPIGRRQAIEQTLADNREHLAGVLLHWRDRLSVAIVVLRQVLNKGAQLPRAV